MTKRLAVIWTAVFLVLTGVPIAMELVAAFDRSKATRPWTDLIVSYVPWELALAAYLALATWLPVHFWVRYRR